MCTADIGTADVQTSADRVFHPMITGNLVYSLDLDRLEDLP